MYGLRAVLDSPAGQAQPTYVQTVRRVRHATDIVRDEKGAGRGTAARLIGKIGPDARDAVPYLVAAIHDPREEVRAQAVVTLGQIGPAARAHPDPGELASASG